MTPALHRQRVEELISSALDNLQASEFAHDPEWNKDWKGHYDKPLRLQMSFADVEITVCHDIDPEFSSDFRLECKFGTVEKSRKEEAFRKLLEENLQFEPSSCRGFGWDEATQQAVFCMTAPVAAPHAESLTYVLSNLAAHAEQWREKLLGNVPSETAQALS
ncbi:MAG: CesT family type III secretion system chaperone [Gammaproteobacteria bacterium]|nr:CesT family type III secretion system chaperone [Gammaproteobacteria bacterium]MBU1440518.1 CesT family type III secretion system chaperone [Gammaproteobacteria bacterium]MBU2410410.1 CesT family type III secretion system chaperone [Gammaproteobacteria bacterium]